MLFVNRIAAGVIEAKRDEAGQNLSAHEAQTARYANAAARALRLAAACQPFDARVA